MTEIPIWLITWIGELTLCAAAILGVAFFVLCILLLIWTLLIQIIRRTRSIRDVRVALQALAQVRREEVGLRERVAAAIQREEKSS